MSASEPPPSAPTAQPKPSGQIIVCEHHYDIDWKVLNYKDDDSISAYYERCYKGKGGGPAPEDPHPFAPAEKMAKVVKRYRERPQLLRRGDLGALQATIRQFVLHLDGCATSRLAFHVLHDERGLSSHFLIDNDGTIFQTLDLADVAYHAGGVNEISIGVELCNRGLVSLDPKHYENRGLPRRDQFVTINSQKLHVWDYSREQYEAMFALGRALGRILPNLPQVYPQQEGSLVMSTLDEVRSYSGYLGHFHVHATKWDPGCFDFKTLRQRIARRAVWFVSTDDTAAASAPEIAESTAGSRLPTQIAELCARNEQEAVGGYYPVGPFGQTRLWHGGIHVKLPPQAPVFSSFSGQLVAARNGPPVATGSRNFVLIKHRLQFGSRIAEFFMLYYHLAIEGTPTTRPPWYQHVAADSLASDEVTLTSLPIGAGELIGHAGQAGPPGSAAQQWQIHVEIISRRNLVERLDDRGVFEQVPSTETGTGHFCAVPEILRAIDRPFGHGNGLLEESEIRAFYRYGSLIERERMRRRAIYFLSEWGDDPNYRRALRESPDFRRLEPAEQEQLMREQIQPSLWWDARVAQHTGLPRSYIVWHYHPVLFVSWMAGLLREEERRSVKAAAPISGGQLSDDRHDLTGYVGKEDDDALMGRRRYDLSQLSAGYPDDDPP